VSKKNKIILLVVIVLIIKFSIAFFVDLGEMPQIGKFKSVSIGFLENLNIPILGGNVHILTLIMTWLIMFVMIICALLIRKSLAFKKPGRIQVLVELMVDFFDDLCTQTLGKERGRRYFPLVMTLMGFLVIANIIGIIPPVWHIIENYKILPKWFIFDAPTTDINTTLGLGIMVFFVVHYSGIKVKGFKTYILDYFEPMFEFGKVKIPNFFMFPLNIVGEIGKVVSHSFRIFGNIMGGSIIIIVVSFLLRQLILPVGLNFFFGIFQGLLQAFVFTMLALTYVAVTISTE
jgi:F-type H+-transporting ATPase subunit a